MPTVPTLDHFSAAPSPMPGVRQSSVASPEMFGADAAQQSRLGNAMLDAGSAMSRIAEHMQQQMDQVREDDALNQLRQRMLDLTYNQEGGYTLKKGHDALKPDDQGNSLADNYAGKLQQAANDITAGLGNDMQRRNFGLKANDIVSQFKGNVQSHMAREYQHYALTTQEGTVKIGHETAIANWNDASDNGPRMQAINSAKSAEAKKGQLTGEGAADTVAKMLTTESKIHLGVIDTAIAQGNTAYALDYFNKYAKPASMTAADMLAVQKTLRTHTDLGTAQQAVSGAMKDHAAAFAPTELDRLVGAATEGTRVGGTVTKTDVSAMARTQISTAAAKYGDSAKAVAAFSASTDEVDAAIKKAEDANAPETWLSYLPKGTQRYVATTLNAVAAGVGTPKPPTEMEFVQSALARLPATRTPEQIKATRDQAEHQYKLITEDRKQRRERAESDAQQALIANGGDFAGLDPQTRSTLARLDPQAYTRVQEFAKNVGGVKSSNIAAYAAATTYPEELAKMGEPAFLDFVKRNFTEADAKHITDLRSGILTGKTSDTADSINSPLLNTLLQERLPGLDIDPKPKKGDTTAMARIGGIQKFLRDDIFAQQQQLGRRMTPKEITDRVDALFTKSIPFRDTLFGVETGTTSERRMLSLTPSDLPGKTLDTIKKSFADRGIQKPTDDDIMQSYWKWKNGR